ncbi:MAG: cupin domain-containing protein [Acidobacteria bacterium]|nr:cupin domain-containing protein [Acidobacteriota bacterium]
MLNSTPEDREEFRAELEQWNMGPLWLVYRSVLTREPRQNEVPYLWRWSVVRPRLLRAGELITAAEAERRVLMFLNPGNAARIGATATLYAAAQLILPGETARAHRHSPSALRFIIEGSGAYTCVEGEKIYMAPGDLVLTPSMVWHDHGDDGSEPVMWLDGLDLPYTAALNCMFLEEYGSISQAERVPQSKGEKTPSEKLYGRALFPAGSAAGSSYPYSPVWAYRWSDAREALHTLARSSEPDAFHAHLLRYANPATGGEILPTMGCRLQLIPQGFCTQAHRSTTSAVCHVAEGGGYSILNGTRFDWEKGDTFAMPIWCWQEHAAPDGDAVLFFITDEPILAPLGLVRSQPFTGNSGHQTIQSPAP